MIPHNRPTLTLREQRAVERVLSSGWVAQGAEVQAFEDELCDFLGIPHGHAVMVSSGSAALYLALWVLDGNRKRIGVPVYACSALRNAVGLIGGESVCLDCASDSPNADTSLLDSKNIDILIATSMFGIPIDVPDNRNYMVIEDIAQSLGASVSGKKIGLRGEVGICSFYATKIMTTGGQGGAVFSRNKEIIDAIKDYRQFDCREDRRLRFNFQTSDLHAAVGRVQLESLPNFMRRREEIFSIYADEGLKFLDTNLKINQPVRYRAVLLFDKPLQMIQSMAKMGITAIVPIEKKELLDGFNKYPLASYLATNSISLPIYPTLKSVDAARIAKIVKGFI